MRIAIDARSVHSPGAGRHFREIIRHIAEIDEKNQYIIYIHQEEQTKLVDRTNFSYVTLPDHPYSLRGHGQIVRQLLRDSPDIFHATDHWAVPFVCRTKLIITFHDFITRVNPEFLGSAKARWYGLLMHTLAVRKADRLIAVSEYVRQELLTYYPNIGDRINVLYNGVSSDYRHVNNPELLEKVKAGFGIGRRYMLYTGSLRKNKNVQSIIEAYAGLPKELMGDIELVISGPMDYRLPYLQSVAGNLNIEDRVHFLGNVTEPDLPSLYSGAEVFVFPTTYEGFGIPVLEALACGTPVITSDIAPTREVAGDAAIFINPYIVSEIRDAMIRIISDRALRETLIRKGLERAGRFTWENTARRLVSIYDEVAGQA